MKSPNLSSDPLSQSLLKQEIEQLKYMVDHHPDVSKFARETLDLKTEIKRMKSLSSGGHDLSKELARTHKYTLQLERQLRHFLTKGESLGPLSFTCMSVQYVCTNSHVL